MRIEISRRIKRYLVWAGFKLRNNIAEYRKRLILEVICCTVYSLVSIILIFINEAETIVMWLNLICLFQVTIHNSIHASEIENKLEELNKKHKIFSYYHMKVAVIIAAMISFAIITVGTAINSPTCGTIYKNYISICNNSYTF